MFHKYFQAILERIKDWNTNGISIPLIRDPKTERGSVSFTLVFFSSLIVIAGLVGVLAGFFGVVDIENALEFFYASCALYFGRKWSSKDKESPGAPDDTGSAK